jgi:RNA polymerase sigma-70 factor (ECF subfamily)
LIDREELISIIPRLRRYARLLTGDRFRADDLVQDTLQRAIERESTFKHGENLRPWVFSLMHNFFIDGKRRKEAVDWTADASQLAEITPDHQSDSLDARDIHGSLEKLPAEQREILLLISVEGLLYREAAEVLGLPVGTVMSRLARAREKMQMLLSDGPATATLGGAA